MTAARSEARTARITRSTGVILHAGTPRIDRMADSHGLKSQYEVAMERLQKAEAESGVEHHAPTEKQKAAIAEIRNLYEAKLAEIDVLYNSRRLTSDPAEETAREEEHRRDRARLVSE